MQNYLRGLLSAAERENGWRIAEEIGAVTGSFALLIAIE